MKYHCGCFLFFQRYMTAEFRRNKSILICKDIYQWYESRGICRRIGRRTFVSFAMKWIQSGCDKFQSWNLLNQTMGYYNSAQNRVIAGSPFLIEPGTEIIPLGASEDALPIIVEEIVSEEMQISNPCL